NYQHYRREREEEYLKSERTAIIANAVVGIVGALAQGQQGYVASAPPPVVYQAPAPAGFWQTQRVEVQPGRYQSQRVWVPDQVDPRTNTPIVGHWKEHQVWVPPVYQETQVWVQR